MTEEHKRKISEAKKGKKCPWISAWNRSRIGYKQKPETIEKRRKSLMGNKSRTGQKQSLEERLKKSVALKGRPKSKDHIRNVALAQTGKKKLSISGEKHWNWQGGITPTYRALRVCLEYKLWRKAVYERDKYTCIECGDNKGGNLNADHIKSFALFPKLRFAIDNGRTLCVPCHKKTDTWGYKSHISRNQVPLPK